MPHIYPIKKIAELYNATSITAIVRMLPQILYMPYTITENSRIYCANNIKSTLYTTSHLNSKLHHNRTIIHVSHYQAIAIATLPQFSKDNIKTSDILAP